MHTPHTQTPKICTSTGGENKVPSAPKAERYARLNNQRGKIREQHSVGDQALSEKWSSCSWTALPYFSSNGYLITEGYERVWTRKWECATAPSHFTNSNHYTCEWDYCVETLNGSVSASQEVTVNVLCTSFILSLVYRVICTHFKGSSERRILKNIQICVWRTDLC